MKLRDKISISVHNIPKWHTRRKIIVFQSDDWGSIRMPSIEIFNHLKKKGYPVQDFPFTKDCLESETDISELSSVLLKFRDCSGHPAAFTMNYIVANPDFRRIQAEEYKNYYYEDFPSTYYNYYGENRLIEFLNRGVKNGIFEPQLHGREHIDYIAWIKALMEDVTEVKDLFNLGICTIPTKLYRNGKVKFQRVFSDREYVNNYAEIVIKDACFIFKNIWEKPPRSFIAPNYFWDFTIEKILNNNNIKIIQGQRAQYISLDNGLYKSKFRFTGQRNSLNQVYLSRNCFFEPSLNSKENWVDKCINEITYSFTFRKPAIIGSHRLNYVGGIDSFNRDRNLELLHKLISRIVQKWPSVEFLTSDQLGSLILRNE